MEPIPIRLLTDTKAGDMIECRIEDNRTLRAALAATDDPRPLPPADVYLAELERVDDVIQFVCIGRSVEAAQRVCARHAAPIRRFGRPLPPPAQLDWRNTELATADREKCNQPGCWFADTDLGTYTITRVTTES